MKLNKKEKTILSAVLASFGIIMVTSGIVMNGKTKPITKTKYTLNVSKQKITEQQARKNEIKLKNITTEENTPISLKVEDYLEDIDQISDDVLKLLKLDTSLVNLSQPGVYQYTITYNKKKYIGEITVKAKEAPKITLRDVTFEIGEASFSKYAKDYINEDLPVEVYNTCSSPNFDEVDIQKAHDNYKYTIKCGDITYIGKVIITNKKPKESPSPSPSVSPSPSPTPEPSPSPDSTDTDNIDNPGKVTGPTGQ